MLEDFAKAIEDCDAAIKLDPTHTKVSGIVSDNSGSLIIAKLLPSLRALKLKTMM